MFTQTQADTCALRHHIHGTYSLMHTCKIHVHEKTYADMETTSTCMQRHKHTQRCMHAKIHVHMNTPTHGKNRHMGAKTHARTEAHGHEEMHAHTDTYTCICIDTRREVCTH